MKQFLLATIFTIVVFYSPLSAETSTYFENDNWTVSVQEDSRNSFCTAITQGMSHSLLLGNVFLSLILNTDGHFSIMLIEEDVIYSEREYDVGFHVDDDRLGVKLEGFGANGPSIMISIPNNEIGRTLVNRISNGTNLNIYDPDNFETLYSFGLTGSKNAIIELSRCAEKICAPPN